jgi:hypothetical protein
MEKQIAFHDPAAAGKYLEQKIEQDKADRQQGQETGPFCHEIGRFIEDVKN